MRAFIFCIALTGFCSAAIADEKYRNFMLFDNCLPMKVIVEKLGKGARSMGMTDGGLRVIAESRLRASRLYIDSALKGSSAFGALHIKVDVVGSAFYGVIGFSKPVLDLSASEIYPVITWRKQFMGTGKPDLSTRDLIMNALSQDMDYFLAEYFRVNEKACGKRRKS